MQQPLVQLLIVLAVAAAMAVAGTVVEGLWVPRPIFGPTDLILPSCLTWLLLTPLVKGRSVLVAVAVGLGSPLLGAAFVLLLGVAGLQVNGVRSFLGGMMYGVAYIVLTAPITLPTGVATALILRWLLGRTAVPAEG